MHKAPRGESAPKSSCHPDLRSSSKRAPESSRLRVTDSLMSQPFPGKVYHCVFMSVRAGFTFLLVSAPTPFTWGNILTLATWLMDQRGNTFKTIILWSVPKKGLCWHAQQRSGANSGLSKHVSMLTVSSRRSPVGTCHSNPSHLSGLQAFPLNSFNGILWYVFSLFHNTFLLVLFYLLVWQRKTPYCEPQNQGSEKKKVSAFCLETMRK